MTHLRRSELFLMISVVDSSAKIPPGILRGNLNQYGDFDECINAIDNNGMSAKYCLAAIHIEQQHSIFGNEISAYHQVKNNLTDVSISFFFIDLLKYFFIYRYMCMCMFSCPTYRTSIQTLCFFFFLEGGRVGGVHTTYYT